MVSEELDQYSQYIDRDRLEYIERQQQLFDQARSGLMTHYLNQCVAFEDGQVLDHDVDEQALSAQVYAKYGYRDLIMQQVTPEKTVYHIGGFQASKDCCPETGVAIAKIEQLSQ
jgi:hypothetical protein